MEYEARQEVLAQAGSTPCNDGDGIRIAQGQFLDELPGIAFALITLFWIVGCFAGMEWRLDTGAMMARAHQLVGLAMAPPHSITIASRAAGAGAFVKRSYDFIARRSAG